MSRKVFSKILENCTKNNVFLFDGKLYQQLDGCPMGGCISSAMANVFLCHHEKRWLDNCPTTFKPEFYRRYVDDTFLLFRSASHIQPFLQYLNMQHPRIKFTHEKEKNNSLPFLDACVINEGNSFSTRLYRKPTFTGLGLKFNSFVPDSYKRNLVKCLIDRAYKLCSTYPIFTAELQNLRKYFIQNNYPARLLEKLFRGKIEEINSPNSPNATVSKKLIFWKVPYLSPDSNRNLKTDLQTLLNKFYPQLQINFIFSNTSNISKFFHYKDRVPSNVSSNVIYKYSCPECGDTYVGETSRHLCTRVAEHRGVSPRTGLPTRIPNSNIYKHFLDTGHQIRSSSFEIIFSQQDSNLKLMESILIHQLKPNLNANQYSTPLHILG